MVRWLIFLLAMLLPALVLADVPATNTYTISFNDSQGCERQYASNIKLEYTLEQLLDGFSNSRGTAWDSWVTRETVQSNDPDKATMKYWVMGGKRGMQLPGKAKLVYLPTSRNPEEVISQCTAEFTRTRQGVTTEPKMLAGTLQAEQLGTLYAPFYAQLFPFGLNLQLPHATLTVGEQWEEKIPVWFISPTVKGAKAQKVTGLFTFVGPQMLDGKRFLVITMEIDSKDLKYKVQQKKGLFSKIVLDGTFRLNGKSTIYFDEQAGEVNRVIVEGTCSSHVIVSAGRKHENASENATVNFSGSTIKVPVAPFDASKRP